LRGLTVEFDRPGHLGAGVESLRAVHEASLQLRKGEVVGVVGESGSGKSTLGLAAMGLLRAAARVSGTVEIGGVDMSAASEPMWRRRRGSDVGMVFQEPMTALNPVMAVWAQIAEPLREHRGMSRASARRRAVELLAEVGIREPERVARMYPHQLSGGMRQRVGIAMAIGCEPALLIADEPTTALDVSVQAQILELLVALVGRMGLSLLLISHNLGVIAETTDRVVVMYRGCVVESGATREVVSAPAHPYTRGLLDCVLSLDRPRDEPLHPIPGSVTPLAGAPRACPFAERCARVGDVCLTGLPELRGGAHACACVDPIAGRARASGGGRHG
jgi:oligopeptide/dipeptide ABC transporter ATP-binding protein